MTAYGLLGFVLGLAGIALAMPHVQRELVLTVLAGANALLGGGL
jgi:hypothetical protein